MCFETLIVKCEFSTILFCFISFIFQLLEIPNLGTFIQYRENTVFLTKKIPLSSSFFFFGKKNEEGLLRYNVWYHDWRKSFLKCLCKSIIEFLICNFSWKWPCSNKSSQITEHKCLMLKNFSCFCSSAREPHNYTCHSEKELSESKRPTFPQNWEFASYDFNFSHTESHNNSVFLSLFSILL